MLTNSDLYQQLQGDGVLAFSDPAGSKACLALAVILLEIDPDRKIRLFSNRSWSFFSQWPVDVAIVQEAPSLVADWIFTGTSSPDTSGRFELGFIASALSAGVTCWAFVDHWTAIADRLTTHEGDLLLPDYVVVTDKRAAGIAATEGIPQSLLIVHANPHLHYIAARWRSRLSRAEIFDAIHAPCSSKMLLYAPDTISLNPGSDWDFNESTALVDLVGIAKDLPDIALVVKAHPLQPQVAWKDGSAAARQAGVALRFADLTIDPLELMSAADLIVGFHSNFLIEANTLRRPILRYFPASPEMDAIAHLEIGLKVRSKEQLRAAICEALT